MKRFFTFILLLALISVLPVKSQGWPENYHGVMLQGFYWDSYVDSNWANLESQADEMSQFFDLIWVPRVATATHTTCKWAMLTSGGSIITAVLAPKTSCAR